jgi:hypothetical protein
MSLVALRVAKQAALIVPARRLVRGARRRRRIRTGRQVRGGVPLCAARRLLDVVPALAALVPLLDPPGGHWGWCAHGCGRTDGDGRLAVGLLLRVALLALGWVALALGRVALALGRVLLVLALRRVLLLLLGWGSLAVEGVGGSAVTVIGRCWNSFSMAFGMVGENTYPRPSSQASDRRRATPSSSS